MYRIFCCFLGLSFLWITGCDIAEPVVSVTGISLSEYELQLETGAEVQISTTIAPYNASNKDVTWKSSNKTVAIVDGTGLVRALAKGTATITVSTLDGDYRASCSVFVTGQVGTIGNKLRIGGFEVTLEKVFYLRNAYGAKCRDSPSGAYIPVAKLNVFNGSGESEYVSPYYAHLINNTHQSDYIFYIATAFHDETGLLFEDNQSQTMQSGTNFTTYIVFEGNALFTDSDYSFVYDSGGFDFEVDFSASQIL